MTTTNPTTNPAYVIAYQSARGGKFHSNVRCASGTAYAAHPFAVSATVASSNYCRRCGPAFADLAADPDAVDCDTVHAYAQRLATAQVMADRWDTVCRVVGPDRTTTEALAFVVERTIDALLITGADDEWSGRRNDLRRVKFDATRRWVENARNVLQFG